MDLQNILNFNGTIYVGVLLLLAVFVGASFLVNKQGYSCHEIWRKLIVLTTALIEASAVVAVLTGAILVVLDKSTGESIILLGAVAVILTNLVYYRWTHEWEERHFLAEAFLGFAKKLVRKPKEKV